MILTPEERTKVGEAWIKAGIDEHASIVSFSRFILHLLSLGAPPDLLRDAIRAMGDEVEHASLCFGIAKQITGDAIGPDNMDISDIMAKHTDIKGILEAAIVEGCLGETFAAHSATFAQKMVGEPSLKNILSKIAEDEMRHADLSWRFVEWVMETKPDLHTFVEHVFNQKLKEFAALQDLQENNASKVARLESSDNEALLERFGHLSTASRHHVIQKALKEVIKPRMAVMLKIV
ncbi:MAG: acyl-ACP desaturase [Pseudomonadota bacterium]